MELGAFEGCWGIDREIEDMRAGRSGRFAGSARFDRVPGGLAYHENGTLVLEGTAPMAASRRYLWRDAGAGMIEVCFADGRFFHRIDADASGCGTVHVCTPDTYRVRYEFSGWPLWQTEWRVTGPRKTYVLVTRYRPAGMRRTMPGPPLPGGS